MPKDGIHQDVGKRSEVKPLLVLMASVLLLAAVLLYCSLETPSAFEPIVVEIVPSSLGAGVNDYENCLLVNGVARTWAEFAQYLKQRAAATRSVHATEMTEGLDSRIPVHIVAGRESPAVLVQFVCILCADNNCMIWTLRVTGELLAYRLDRDPPPGSVVDVIEEEEHLDDEMPEEEPAPLDPLPWVSILCLSKDGRASWMVNGITCLSIGELNALLLKLKAEVPEGKVVPVVVDVQDGASAGHVYDVYALANSAGFEYFLMAPPRISLGKWPKALRMMPMRRYPSEPRP